MGKSALNLTPQQKKTVIAAFLGWTLDAFDFFLLTFLIVDIAKEFTVDVKAVSYALFLTLAMRWIGAFIFGWLADKFGRKPILMINIVSYSVIGALAAFSPNLTTFLILRAVFGIAMGGEWGLGSALAMETIPPRARGMVSGILQCGYPTGYLLAAVVFGLLDHQTIAGFTFNWRGMFFLSILPALLVLFIRSSVPESPAFLEGRRHPRPGLLVSLRAVKLHVASVDDLRGDLDVHAEKLLDAGASWQYAFRVEHDGRLLAEGRAAVVQVAGGQAAAFADPA